MSRARCQTMHTLPLLLAGGLIVGTPASAETIRVCPEGSQMQSCDLTGNDAVQEAVDRAADGDVIRLAAGRYVPSSYRDVPFEDIAARGYVVIRGKRLAIEGSDGTVLDGREGIPAIAFVLEDADVSFRNLKISDFRWGEEEDDIYDGHGIFAIDSRVRASDIVMRGIVKMALTGRGRTLIDASALRLLDGHLGIWLEEASQAHVRDSVIAGGDSAGIATYDDSTLHLFNSVVANNTDDGVYAADSSTILVTHSVIAGNAPYGINAEAKGRVTVRESAMHANAAPANAALEPGQLVISEDVVQTDPMLDAQWLPKPGSPLLGRDGSGRPIGLTGERP